MSDLRERFSRYMEAGLCREDDSTSLRLRLLHKAVSLLGREDSSRWPGIPRDLKACGQTICFGETLGAMFVGAGDLFRLRTICIRPGQTNVVRSRLPRESRGLFGSERPLGTGSEAEVLEIRQGDGEHPVRTRRLIY